MILILVLYSVKTISRNTDWKDNLTLYSADVGKFVKQLKGTL